MTDHLEELLKAIPKPIEIRNDDKGGFDELIAFNATVHIEMMDDNKVWLGIETAEKSYGMWISSKKKLSIYIEDQTDPGK